MTVLRARALLLLPLLGLACERGCGHHAPTTAAEVAGELRARLASLRSYEVVLESRIDSPTLLAAGGAPDPQVAARGETQLVVALPDRMRLQSRTAGTPGVEVTSVFDGETMWCRMVVGGLEGEEGFDQTVRLDQRQLGRAGAPFDVGFSLRGHGLEDGQDLVGTVRKLLDTYALAPGLEAAAVGGEPCFRLRGQRPPEAQLARMLAEPQTAAGLALALGGGAQSEEQLATTLADLLCATRSLELFVSQRDLLPRRWVVGGGTRGGTEVTVTRLAAEAKLSPILFRISPEALGKARDLTKELLEVRGKLKRGGLPRAVADRLTARVREGLKRCGQAQPASGPASRP